MDRHGHDRGHGGLTDHLQRHQRFRAIAEGFGDDVVDAGVHGPADLLLEHGPAGHLGRRIVRLVDIGVADVACEQSPALHRHLL